MIFSFFSEAETFIYPFYRLFYLDYVYILRDVSGFQTLYKV
jgi:hypothetical protein